MHLNIQLDHFINTNNIIAVGLMNELYIITILFKVQITNRVRIIRIIRYNVYHVGYNWFVYVLIIKFLHLIYSYVLQFSRRKQK